MIKKLKPITPSQRHRTIINKKKLHPKNSIKSLTYGLTKSGGRNNKGRITSYHKGGGNKKMYREINFKRNEFGINGVVTRLEYDPNRSAFIALILYDNGIYKYILAPKNLKIGDSINSGQKEIKLGHTLFLKDIPVGQFIHNIELKPGKGGQFIRSAGGFAKVIKKDYKTHYVTIRLNNNKYYLIHMNCLATIGIVSNMEHKHIKYGKAGVKRWLNKRPTVRGVAMNPIDHPHGGGEGKSKSGRVSVTPWGKITKGQPTRKIKRTNKWIL